MWVWVYVRNLYVYITMMGKSPVGLLIKEDSRRRRRIRSVYGGLCRRASSGWEGVVISEGMFGAVLQQQQQ